MNTTTRYIVIYRLALTAAFFCVATIGCKRGPDYETCNVNGMATYGGKPIPDGLVTFEPDASKGNKGRAASAFIKDGLYDTRNQGRGVRPGPMTIRVAGFDGVNAAQSETGHGKPLFREFKVNREISGDEKIDIDVPAGEKR